MEYILKELPDTENIPSEEDIMYNLQGLIGFFIAKDMKKAGKTVYWAEQILRYKTEETRMSDILALMSAIDAKAITPQVELNLFSDKSGVVIIENEDFTEEKGFDTLDECCEILKRWV